MSTVLVCRISLAELADAGGAVANAELTDDAIRLLQEMGVPKTLQTIPAQGQDAIAESAKTLSYITLIDIGVFFVVLMLGFFYVWKRGDLDWVKAVVNERRRDRTPSEA